MPANSDFDRLEEIAVETSRQSEFGSFGRYVDLRAKGLRRAAMDALSEFLTDWQGRDFEARRNFSTWVVERASNLFDQRLLIPHDLIAKLIAPTVREWRVREPGSAFAHYLSGWYCRGEALDPKPLDAFRRSVALDPSFEKARRDFIDWVRNHADIHQHELPYGYLGSAEEDVRDLSDALEMLQGIDDPQWRKAVRPFLSKQLEKAVAWRDFKQWEDDGIGRARPDRG